MIRTLDRTGSWWRLPAVVCLAIGLTGCGLGSFTSGFGGGILGGSPGEPKVNEDQVLAAARDGETLTGTLGEVSVSCPRITVMSRDNSVTIYEPGRAGDGLAVVHRGELTKTARECQVDGGRVTIKYGFSGRVLLGPKGRSGLVALPVKIALTDAKRETIRSETVRVETAVTVEKPIAQFSSVRTVTFELPVGARPGEFEIQVGFDRNVPGAG